MPISPVEVQAATGNSAAAGPLRTSSSGAGAKLAEPLARRLVAAIPAFAVWFDASSAKENADLLGDFLVARFGGRALWVLADPARDAFLGDDDIEIVVDATRESGALGVGWMAAATPAFLAGLPRAVGVSWDGWLLLDGKHDRNALLVIADAWRDSRIDLDNSVAAEACYPYGDGTGLVWVPELPLDEAQVLLAGPRARS